MSKGMSKGMSEGTSTGTSKVIKKKKKRMSICMPGCNANEVDYGKILESTGTSTGTNTSTSTNTNTNNDACQPITIVDNTSIIKATVSQETLHSNLRSFISSNYTDKRSTLLIYENTGYPLLSLRNMTKSSSAVRNDDDGNYEKCGKPSLEEKQGVLMRLGDVFKIMEKDKLIENQLCQVYTNCKVIRSGQGYTYEDIDTGCHVTCEEYGKRYEGMLRRRKIEKREEEEGASRESSLKETSLEEESEKEESKEEESKEEESKEEEPKKEESKEEESKEECKEERKEEEAKGEEEEEDSDDVHVALSPQQTSSTQPASTQPASTQPSTPSPLTDAHATPSSHPSPTALTATHRGRRYSLSPQPPPAAEVNVPSPPNVPKTENVRQEKVAEQEKILFAAIDAALAVYVENMKGVNALYGGGDVGVDLPESFLDMLKKERT
jgi:hypothetical protein